MVTKNNFEATTKLVNGRFQVKLPFKPDATPLGESKASALRRFLMLKKRLEANLNLHQQCRGFIHEFIDLEQLEEVPNHELDLPPHKCFYLPHHCVPKESTTTKLRVAFGASAKTSKKSPLMMFYWWDWRYKMTCLITSSESDAMRLEPLVTTQKCIDKSP